MKRTITLAAIIAIIALPALSQEQQKLQKLENLENKTDTLAAKDTTAVEIGKEIFSYKESGDEARVTIGKKEYRIIDNADGVSIYKNDSENGREFRHRSSDRFRGHLGGLELGFNGYMYDDWSTSIKPADNYMDLNTGKSSNWNIIFPSLSIGFARHFGMVAAIGINFNYYRFDGNNSITKDVDGVIGPLYPDAGITYSKSKLYTTYATLPVLFEGQIPVGNHHNTINIGAGVIGAVKLGSHTKVVYYTGGKEKAKDKDDFSLNVLRWGGTARIGYGCFQVYGTRYFTSLFEQGKGPELYPYEIGIAITFNN
jgi:hypothetical protein